MGIARRLDRISLRIAATYLLMGTAWILLSDRLLALLVTDVRSLTAAQTVKGWVFVLGTAAAMYFLISRSVYALLRSEEALRERDRTLDALLANLPGMAYRCRNDSAWTMEFLSEGCRELTGHEPSELVGNAVVAYADLIVPEDRDDVWEAVQTALKQRRRFQLTYRISAADGRRKWVWEQGTGVFNSQGELVALEGFITDITERKNAEAELIRLGTAVEQAAEAVIMTDPGGVIEYVNPAFEAMSGYLRDEALGRDMSFLHCGDDPGVFQRARRAVEGVGQWRGHLVCERGDGSTYEAESTISPVRDERGRVTNFVAVHRDVTEQMRLESQLRQTQKLQALGTLAGGVAHDFNNILTPIIGFAQLLLDGIDGPLSAEQCRDLERIVTGAVRAQDLVGQILTFARQVERRREPVCLGSIVEETLKLLRATLPKTIEIRYPGATTTDLVVADPTQLHQVVLNLCTNAAHAIGDGPGVLEVRLGEADAGAASKIGPCVCLAVSDTGCGMAPEVLERIFEPFFTTKRPGEGTGMGLAVVHGIVESHGGKIFVTSEPGRGTTFRVLLPRAREAPAQAVSIPEPIARGSERILFVDDEEPIVELARKILENLGYRFEGFANPSEALERFRRDPEEFDLIIADLNMPGMTGLDFLRRVVELRPQVPTILCTGLGGSDPSVAGRPGARRVLAKPLSVRQLATAIRQALDGAEG
jgi:PAS domain S-box-containing protein